MFITTNLITNIGKIQYIEAAIRDVLKKKGVFKNFANFTEKYPSLFLIKLQGWLPASLLKRDSNTGVFCEIYEIFEKT